MDSSQFREKSSVEIKKRMSLHFDKELLFIIVPLILFAILFPIIPFEYSLILTNEKGSPVIGNISIYNSYGQIVFFTNDSKSNIFLFNGDYQVSISARGYEKQKFNISNPLYPLNYNDSIYQTITMKPTFVDFTNFNFLDPTQTLKLYPTANIEGTNILGENVMGTVDYNGSIMYGSYNISFFTKNFFINITSEGDDLNLGLNKTSIVLLPRQFHTVLTKDDVKYIFNFLKDYLNYSVKGYLPNEDRGFPNKFFLYDKNLSISMGDILFLFCELNTYNISFAQPIFFVPNNFTYTLSTNARNYPSCYSQGLDGVLPLTISGTDVSKILIMNSLGRSDINYDAEQQLTSVKTDGVPISFTFDVESGRYVFGSNKGQYSLSPCTDSITKLGIEKNELVCNNPDVIGWFSPFTGTSTLNNYPYPWNTGIYGLKETMSYSEQYGIPATYFIVVRDYRAFKQLSPSVVAELKYLVNNNLIEIGSHTVYHPFLSSLSMNASENEMRKSREYLMTEFNTTVTGFRSPYHAVTDNGNYVEHSAALINAGYSYRSGLQPQISIKLNVSGLAIKPSTTSLTGDDRLFTSHPFAQDSNFIITLDHTWDLFYQQTVQNNQYSLQENLTNSIKARKNILVALSNGAVPMKTKDIPISLNTLNTFTFVVD